MLRLKRSNEARDLTIAGKPAALFASDAQAVAWLEDKLGPQHLARSTSAEEWTMFRGDESRNAASAGGQPLLNVRWQQRVADDDVVEKFIGKVHHDYLNQDIVALPSLHPLAVGDVVVMRTAFGIEAVDFNNGKLVWKYPAIDGALEQFLKVGSLQQHSPGSQQLMYALDQRVWEDAVYGTLSSDGSQIYYIDELGLAGVTTNIRYTVAPNGRRTQSGAAGHQPAGRSRAAPRRAS